MKRSVKQSNGWSHQEYTHYSLGLADKGAMESSFCEVALPNQFLERGSSMLTHPQYSKGKLGRLLSKHSH